MNEDLVKAVDAQFDNLQEELAALVRIPSVSAKDFDPDQVRRSAEAVADLFRKTGRADDVRLLEVEGAHPAVYAHYSGPTGAPTVLLYAHHDVQPPGPAQEWITGPFEPFAQDGRLYGRGASDDKAGVILHAGAIAAFGGALPVSVKIFVEGEEEMGSTHLAEILDAYAEDLASDVIVIGDSGNWRTGEPALTTSLRGVASCAVEVRTLAAAVHSGEFGGVFPDALMCLSRLLATLHDDQGNVAVPGLVANEADGLDMGEDELRSVMKTVAGLETIGEGPLTSRVWNKPCISILAIDAPPVKEAINQLVPVARARVSLRTAPGEDGAKALNALKQHLLANVPWGAEVTVSDDNFGEAYAAKTDGPAFEAFRSGFRQAFGIEAVDMGMGGSIPFVADFAKRYPGNPIVLMGPGDPPASIHAPNESQDLSDLKRIILAEAIALRELGG